VLKVVGVFVLALTIACGTIMVSQPEPTPGLRYLVELGRVKEHQEALRRLVQFRVAERFGNVSTVETQVWWVERRLRYKGEEYGGLCFKCTEIYVYDRRDLCTSSYIHELIHCYHRRIEGWRDFEHENLKWWKLVDELKIECRELGW
jgi:hypothetical protein